MIDIVQVFTKVPLPNQVKTRLIPQLGAQGAADFQAQLIEFTLKKVCLDFSVQLWCAPTDQYPFFQHCQITFGVSLHRQEGENLGMRMANALEYAQLSPTVLIGTDCPSLQLFDIKTAFLKLHENYDIVIAPAEDGGYVLIGMKAEHPELFTNIPWGTSQVFELTRKKINELNLRCYELPLHWDIDRPEDFIRWKIENNL
jgi:rSAM/selenodomain-associated transferase 1